METLTITNLGGPLTRKRTGDIKSGLARFETSWGYDPYSKPGNLTWMEQPVSILTLTGSNGPIVAMKQRSEALSTVSNNFVFTISSDRSLRRIQSEATSDAFEDSPSVIGLLISSGGQRQFDRGVGFEFYNGLVWFGGSNEVQRIDFDGANVASVLAGTQNTPRPLKSFLGKLYFGNGNNIGEIDTSNAVTTLSKLSPALPDGILVHDLDTTTDGNYLQLTATRGQLANSPTGDIQPGVSFSESFKFLWNGIDPAVTAVETHEGTRMTASEIIGDTNYSFGYDQQGMGILQGKKKIVTIPNALPPFPQATFSTSNMLGFVTTEYVNDNDGYRGAVYNYGQYDDETQPGLFRLLRVNAVTSGSDVVMAQTAKQVSNLIFEQSYRGADTGSIASASKMYFSVTEASALGSPVGPHRLMRFNTIPTGLGSIVAGTYETQTQMFSKKAKIGEVRLYTEPLIGGNDFVVDLIGSGGSVMAGGSQRFQVATGSVATGTDMVQFNPAMAPTYALGVRITNSSVTGVANWTANKIEVDYLEGGR